MHVLPEMIRIKQDFENKHISDIPSAIYSECEKLIDTFPGGEKIALAVGSRGISGLPLIVKTVVSFLKEHGNEVIIIPAMGSHGGATPQGQREVLEGYGITEQEVGAPVVSSMETVELDSAGLSCRVFIDKNAWACDGIVVINRIKPHTDYSGEIESGLIKMCCIGLGKQRQAEEIHHRGVEGLKELILPAALRIIREAPIRMGIGIVENHYHQPGIITALHPEDFYQEERKLLVTAKHNIPALPVRNIDILCIDEMGKDISGVGIDTNIIGYTGIRNQEPKRDMNIRAIIVNDLTPESHGNALGLGLADFITENLYRKIDVHATRENAVTSTFMDRAKIPIVMKDYDEAVETAMEMMGKNSGDIRMVRIKNTLKLQEMYVSRKILEELSSAGSVHCLGDFTPWRNLEEL